MIFSHRGHRVHRGFFVALPHSLESRQHNHMFFLCVLCDLCGKSIVLSVQQSAHTRYYIANHKNGRARFTRANPANNTAVLLLIQFCNHLFCVSHQWMFWVVANKSLQCVNTRLFLPQATISNAKRKLSIRLQITIFVSFDK